MPVTDEDLRAAQLANLQAQLRLIDAETEVARTTFERHAASLMVSLMNDRYGASGRSVQAVAEEAVKIMKAAAVETRKPDFYSPAT